MDRIASIIVVTVMAAMLAWGIWFFSHDVGRIACEATRCGLLDR